MRYIYIQIESLYKSQKFLLVTLNFSPTLSYPSSISNLIRFIQRFHTLQRWSTVIIFGPKDVVNLFKKFYSCNSHSGNAFRLSRYLHFVLENDVPFFVCRDRRADNLCTIHYLCPLPLYNVIITFDKRLSHPHCVT